MRHSHSIYVCLAAAFTVVAACSEGADVMAPLDDAPDVVGSAASARATIQTIEPERLHHKRFYAAESVVRQCQINSLEDLDGDDFRRTHGGGSTQELYNEKDGFVMIREFVWTDPTPPGPGAPTHVSPDWTVTHIGVTTWNAEIWRTGSGGLISANSQAQGVVVPVSPGEPLLDWLNEPGDVEPTHDLTNELFEPGARATERVKALLREGEADGTLVGVNCRAAWKDEFNFSFIHHNEVTFEKHYPGALRKLF